MVVNLFSTIVRRLSLPAVLLVLVGCGGAPEGQFDKAAASETMIQAAASSENLEVGVRYLDLFKDAMVHDPKLDPVGSRRALDRVLLNLQKYDAPRPEELKQIADKILPPDRPSTKEVEKNKDPDIEEPPEESLYRAVEVMAAAFDKYKAPPTPIEFLRYRTIIEVAFDQSPEFTAAVRERVRQDIAESVSRTWGTMWRTEVVDSHWLSATAEGLKLLQPEVLVEKYPFTETDKVFFFSVKPSGAQYEVAGVEWDSSSRELTEIEIALTHQKQLIGDVVRGLLIKLFRPVLELKRKEFSKIEFRLMGGEYPAPDPEAAQVVIKDIVRPFLRFRNRKDKTVKKIQMLPLNYVVINRVERGRVIGTHINPSGSYSPFGGKARSVDQLGLRQRPRVESSSVQLVMRGRLDRPLVCHRVEVIPKLTVRDSNLADSTHMLSDRQGRVTITRDPNFTNFWLYVRSGEFILAKIPYVPGITASDTVELPDDAVRLRVEGEISMLRGKLLDSVARRATFMAEATGAAKAGKWEDAQAALAKMDAMPGLDDFKSELNTIEVPSVEKTTILRQPYATAKIKKKCSQVAQILNRFFDKKKDAEFREKLRDTYEGAVADQ